MERHVNKKNRVAGRTYARRVVASLGGGVRKAENKHNNNKCDCCILFIQRKYQLGIKPISVFSLASLYSTVDQTNLFLLKWLRKSLAGPKIENSFMHNFKSVMVDLC